MNELITKARELCEKATPGPWEFCESGNTVKSHMVITRSPWKCITGGISPKTNNAAFIAASRTLVPRLCDALETMTARAEKAEAENQRYRERENYPCYGYDCYERGNYHAGCESCPYHKKPLPLPPKGE